MTLEDLIKELVDAGSNIAQYYTGTQADYNALEEKDDGSIYFITDTHLIYKGNTCFSGVREITVITENPTGAEGDSGYDKRKEQHVIIITNHNGEKVAVTLKTVGAIDEMYKDLQDHKRTKASDNVLAHVVLSDDISPILDVNNGTAATPKAVSEALQLAKKYTEEVVSTQGSFEVLKGYVATDGIIESAIDSTINGINIDSLTGYKKGWAFLVKVSGNYVGVDCEVNDKIICVNDYVDTHYSSDFIVMQVNVDGAVTSTEQLTKDAIIVGDGGHSIKHLANGDNKQVMTIVGGKPSWADNVDTTYTFTDGTDGSFNVTPKGGQTQKVKIGKPSNAGHADTATEATHATNADNATRANSAVEANHALNADEAIHSETADLADDLGGKPETHEENFVYQPTASDLSIKDGFADIKKLKGNTVVWNQLAKRKSNVTSSNSITITDNNNGSYTINGTATEDVWFTFYSLNQNRIPYKYYLRGCPNGGSSTTYYLGGLYIWDAISRVDYGEGIIINDSIALNYSDEIGIVIKSGYTANNLVFKPQLFNLTRIFGEGNEPATVEEFEAMFPNDYYEYNEGELMSFDGKGLKSVGFNQWDEEWELGLYSVKNGLPTVDTNSIRSKNKIKCIGGESYYVKADYSGTANNVDFCFYDDKFNFIEYKYGKNEVITFPQNASYFTLFVYQYGTTYNNDICINFSHTGYRNGEYEPYEDYKLAFQDGKTISQLTGKLNGEGDSVVIFPDGLRSAGEAFDEIVYDEATGKHKAVKRIGSVYMGDLSWTKQDGRYWARIKGIAGRDYDTNIICARYIRASSSNNFVDKTITGLGLYYTDNIVVKDSSYADAYSFKASLQGQMLYYELAEPEVYELDFPINTSYEAYDFGTEEVLYNDDKEVNIPMKASIEYGFNAVDMIRGNYFDIQKLKKKAITTDGGAIEGDLSVDNLTAKTINASESITAQTFVGDLEGKAKNAENADKLTTARMIKIKGAVESDSPRFDGTQDIEIDTTVIGSKINWGEDINITDKNLVTSIENNRNAYQIDITGRAGTAGYAESITSVSELNVDNPSTTNIPNEKAVTDAVMTLVNLLTWKTIGGNE